MPLVDLRSWQISHDPYCCHCFIFYILYLYFKNKKMQKHIEYPKQSWKITNWLAIINVHRIEGHFLFCEFPLYCFAQFSICFLAFFLILKNLMLSFYLSYILLLPESCLYIQECFFPGKSLEIKKDSLVDWWEVREQCPLGDLGNRSRPPVEVHGHWGCPWFQRQDRLASSGIFSRSKRHGAINGKNYRI